MPPRPALLLLASLLLTSAPAPLPAAVVLQPWRVETAKGEILTGAIKLFDGKIEVMPLGSDTAVAVDESSIRRLRRTTPLDLAPVAEQAATPGQAAGRRTAAALEGDLFRDHRVGGAVADLMVSRTGENITLRGGVGEVLLAEDAFRFLAHPLPAEGELRGAVIDTRSGGTENAAYALGGLMLRESLAVNSRFVAVTLDSAGATQLFVRRELWRGPELVQVALAPRSPLRFVRETEAIRLLVADPPLGDAPPQKDAPPDAPPRWRCIWAEPIGFASSALGGAFVTGRAESSTLTVSGLEVRHTSGATTHVPGVYFTSGSFLSGELHASPDPAYLILSHRSYDIRVPHSAIALIAFSPVTPAQAELLCGITGAGPGVMLQGPGSDILQGRITSLSHASLDLESVAFGGRTFSNRALRAVALGPLPDSPSGLRLRTDDGSLLSGTHALIRPEGITLSEPGLPPNVPLWRLDEVIKIDEP